MNITQQTMGLAGIPDAAMLDTLRRTLGSPDGELAKALSPNWAGRLAAFGGGGGYSPETLAALEALKLGELAKTISIATGLLAYDLQAPAKNLYSFYTPIRDALPRVGGGTGSATNWKQISNLVGSGFDAMGWIPEGQRSGVMSYTTADKSATYRTIGEEDAATYEAISGARGFEDVRATMTFRLLQKMMLKEEMALLAGNQSIALGTPATPTVSAITNAASTLTTATYYVQVAALTLEGYQNAVRSGVLSIPTQMTVTGADGQTYQLNGGSSNISALSSGQAVTSGTNMLAMSTTAIQGAVAYAWFIGTTNSAGTGTLQAITGINSYARSTALSTGNQLASVIAADYSRNTTTAFDGLLTSALASGSNAYVRTLATGTAGTGTVLTASGRGSVVEIDLMLKTMFDNYLLSPTVLYVSSQELQNITNKVLTGNSSSSLLRFDTPADGSSAINVQAGGVISSYYNPFAPPDAGMRIPVRIHPRLPPGTILGWCQNLPVQYQSNQVPNVAEVKTRQDYYQIDWPIVTRAQQVGVYAEEVLAVYAPFAMGVITNIADG